MVVPVMQVFASTGFLTAVAAATAYVHRHLPRVYPRGRTRLDERTYRVVRRALAVGVVVGGFGTVLSLVDTVGSIRAIEASHAGFLAGIALLVPPWLGPSMVEVGVGVLIGGAVLAGVAETRNAWK